MQKSLNANQLKGIALLAMTVDHTVSVLFPNYPTDWWILLLHAFGRITAPIFWFFLAEGYHYTRSRRKYAIRLFLFAVLGHFAYAFAFGIPFVPFQNSVFNQTSVLWPLFLGLVLLCLQDCAEIKKGWKILFTILILLFSFPSDWSCIAVLAVWAIHDNRGDFKKQMLWMLFYVSFYALVYALFIHPLYGVLQMAVALSIPLLKRYDGTKGRGKFMKSFFYLYYPLHLLLLGLLRLSLYGNVGVMIGA